MRTITIAAALFSAACTMNTTTINNPGGTSHDAGEDAALPACVGFTCDQIGCACTGCVCDIAGTDPINQHYTCLFYDGGSAPVYSCSAVASDAGTD